MNLNRLFFLGCHIPLSLILFRYSQLATLHAYIVLLMGLYWAFTPRYVDKTLNVIGYIVGSEVLWRMCDARIFWEYGKYAMSLVMVIALLRRGRSKPPTMPLIYILSLIPSCIMSFFDNSFEVAKGYISFNLSGPLSLFISWWFFQGFSLPRKNLLTLLIAIVSPVIGILVIAVYSTITAANLTFTNESNFITSGGYGPNQVSAALGLGALFLLFFYIFGFRLYKPYRFVLLIGLLSLATQSAITFSRNGLILFLCAAMVGCFYLLSDFRYRKPIVTVVIFTVVIGGIYLFPKLFTFTEGKIVDRFSDFKSTGRDEVIYADFNIWLAHPVFGVGVGKAPFYRHEFIDHSISAHTEFSRLIAEHGIFGMMSLLLLMGMAFGRINQAKYRIDKAICASLIAWSLLYMLVNAMRMVAPSFVFGLAMARFIEDD